MADGTRLHPPTSPGSPARVSEQTETSDGGRPFSEDEEKDSDVINCAESTGPGDITKD